MSQYDTLITYDVDSKWEEYKNKLIKDYNYLTRWTSNDQAYYLPNTTLWKKNSTVTNSKSEMEKCAKSLNIKLIRAMAVKSSTWSGIHGEK